VGQLENLQCNSKNTDASSKDLGSNSGIFGPVAHVSVKRGNIGAKFCVTSIDSFYLSISVWMTS
jgi:hypothetical protein